MSEPIASTSTEHFWSPAYDAASLELGSIRSSLSDLPTPLLRISKVSQLDSTLLDRELNLILQEPLVKALELLRGPSRYNFEIELLTLLKFVILRLSLADFGSSYGEKLQNLKYRDERLYISSQKSSPLIHSPTALQFNLYTLLAIAPPYLFAKTRDLMLSHGYNDFPLPATSFIKLWLPLRNRNERERSKLKRERKRWLWETFNTLEKYWNLISLGNFLLFLYNGKYRSLIERFLKIRLVYAHRSVTRNVSFEFLNRQLVWEVFTEFLLFLMPLINLRKLRLRLTRVISHSRALQLLLSSIPSALRRTLNLPEPLRSASKDKDSDRPQVGPLHHLPPTLCAICYSRITSPPSTLPTSVNPSDPSTSNSSLVTLNQSFQPSSTNCEVKIPYRVNCCKTLYCYFCISGKLIEYAEENGSKGKGWECLRCGKGVKSVERYEGEVISDTNDVEEVEDTDVEVEDS